MDEEPRSWAVVGGGLLGMELCRRLARRGERVTLVEASEELGGLASTWEIGEVRWDRHYHVIAPGDARTLRLIDDLSLGDELQWCSVPAGCESEGRIHPATTPREILALPFLNWTSKARLGITAARAAVLRDPSSLENVTATEWLTRWSGRQATARFWLPLLRSKLGKNVEAASAVFIATTLQRLLFARRAGGAAGDGFGFVSGGYARILGRLSESLSALEVEVELGRRVTRIARCDGRIEIQAGEAWSGSFDRVIVTAAAPIAAAVCVDLEDSEARACRDVTYQGIVCLSVLLRRPLTPNYITYLLSAAPFTAVIDMSALVGPAQLGGHGLVYLPAYIRSDDPLLDAGEQEITDSFLSGLERLYPGAGADVVATRLSKVRYVLPVPTLGYSKGLPPVVTSVPGLYLASSALITDGTLNVDETLGVVDRALSSVFQEAR